MGAGVSLSLSRDGVHGECICFSFIFSLISDPVPRELGLSQFSSLRYLEEIDYLVLEKDPRRTVGEVRSVPSFIDRGFVEMAPLPFHTNLAFAVLTRASLEPGGCSMSVFVIYKSGAPDPRFHSIPSPTPAEWSMGLLLSTDPGGGFLMEFEIPKSWVPDLILLPTASPTLGSMDLLSNGFDSGSTDPFEGIDGVGAGAVGSDLRISNTGGRPLRSLLPASYLDTDSSDARALKVHDDDEAGNVGDGVADAKNAYITVSEGISLDLQGVVMSCSVPVRADSSIRHKTPIRSVSGDDLGMLGFSTGDSRTGKLSWVERVPRATDTADDTTDAAVITEMIFLLYQAFSTVLSANGVLISVVRGFRGMCWRRCGEMLPGLGCFTVFV